MTGVFVSRARFLLGFIPIIMALAIIHPKANAATPNQEITITPTTVNITVQPGSINNGKLEVLDQGKSSYTFTVYSAPYSVKGEDYTPDFTLLPGAPTVASWFQFSTNQSQLVPNQAMSINYVLSIPPDTLPGGYYAVVFAETHAPQANNGVTLNERVGEIFYIRVAGPVTQKGSFLTWQTSFLQEPPLTSTLRLEDSGSIHYESNITFKVRDIFGNTKFTLDTQKILLPQTIRRIPLLWPKSPSIGLFKVTGSAKFLNQTHNLGTKYVLVVSKTIRIYVVVILLALVLLIIIRAIWRTLRKAKRQAKEKLAGRKFKKAKKNSNQE